MAAPRPRSTAPHEDASEGEDLASVPEKYQLTHRTYLTKAGAETLRKELTDPNPKVSDKLRALVRGIKR
jgi:hypothetical protein